MEFLAVQCAKGPSWTGAFICPVESIVRQGAVSICKRPGRKIPSLNSFLQNTPLGADGTGDGAGVEMVGAFDFGLDA
jgi:hypothetical protein